MTKNQRFYYVFVGGYGNEKNEAIQILLFDSKDGKLSKVGSVSRIANPSFLTVNKDLSRLYSISEVVHGEVVSYNLDLASGRLTEINRQSTTSSSPCYVSLNDDEQWLFATNYGGGSITVHPLKENGAISPLTDFRSHNAIQQQRKSHPHQIKNIPHTDKYLVTDLGLDRLYLYQFNRETSMLVLKNEVAAVVGSGPRHLTVHPELRNVYVANEFNSSISVYSYNEAVESLKLVQQIKTIPSDFDGDNYCADIHISPSNSFLYVSNRGHNSIATFTILGDGKLEKLNYSSTMGKWPRNFAIVPNGKYILVANQHTNSIVVMKIGEKGVPQATDNIFPVNSPSCLHITGAKYPLQKV